MYHLNLSLLIQCNRFHSDMTHRVVVAITTAQLHSTNSELRFCTVSNPARDLSEIRDGEDL